MRTMLRGTLAVLVAVAALGTAASAAFAQSTTMSPSGDSVSLSSAPVKIVIPTFFKSTTKERAYRGTTTCTLNGGSFVIPSTGNKNGPVTVSYASRPSFTGCTEITEIAEGKERKVPLTITTAGEWTLSAQYGTGHVTVTVPKEGLTINVNGEPAFYVKREAGPVSFNGHWENGFPPPMSVSSTIEYGGAVTLYEWEEGELHKEIDFPQVLETMTDTTHPASLPVVGP
jgi:hypothetical protein